MNRGARVDAAGESKETGGTDANPAGGTEAGPGELDSVPPGTDASGLDVVSMLWTFGKCLGSLLPVYLAGYLGLGIGVVVFGLMLYMGWKFVREGKENRLRSAMYFLEHEEDVTTARIFRSKRDLPAWVNFPDVERVEWLNKILQQAWPFVGQYLEKLLVESIAPTIRDSNPHLQTFTFTKVNLGDKALRVIGMKAHTEMDKRQVLLDMYVSYVGDVEISVEIKKYFCKAGVKGIQLHGMLRVILEPLIGDVPLVGAITMFFIQRPRLDINWTGITNLLDIPGLNAFSDTMIMDTISSFLVLPNRLTVPLVADLHVAQLRSPLPRGVVRIHLKEAQNLLSTDTLLGGAIKGKSDPYVILRVGTQTFTSKTVDDNLNPKWNEMYEVIVHEVPGQELELEVFDKDPDQDDFLGRLKMDLGCVKKARVLDQWMPLKDVEKGRVHLRLEWLSLLSTTSKLEQVLQQNSILSTKISEPPSAAILAVYLDRAQELPMKKGNKDPSPVVLLSVQDTTRESRTCYGTNNPVWEDAFHFFIQNPQTQDLDIQVKDDSRQLSLGSLSLPLGRLLNSQDLTLDQWFQLENSGLASRIYMKAVLRILFLDGVPPKSPLNSSLSVPLPQGGEGVVTEERAPEGTSVDPPPRVPRPEYSSADDSFATEGVLHIHLLEAQNLIAKDNFLKGMVKGKSDPYVVTRAGGVTFRSHVIKENLNPRWNELYEVIMTEVQGQEVEFEVFDKDVDADDFLGRLKIGLREIITNQYTDEWFTLSDVKSGQIHLILEWLPRVADISNLQQVLHTNMLVSYQNKVHPSAAILSVYVDRAHALPLKKNLNEPKAGAELSLGGLVHRTKVCESSTAPVWEEAFTFLVKNPYEDMLLVKLSHSWGLPLGSLVVSMKEVLAGTDLTLDRWFQLDGAGPESQILLRATLRILVPKSTDCSVREGGPEFRTALVADSTTPGESMELQEEPIPVNISSKEESGTSQDLRHRQVSAQSASEQVASPLGQVRLTLYYQYQEKRLLVTVHSCRKLKACSKDGSDPYVSLILLPDKNQLTKRKTAVKKRSLNPDYNDKFEFDMGLEEAQKRRLEVSVKNSVSFMSRERELIGKVLIDLSQVDLVTGVGKWYDLQEEAA
ncbi:extended synaptotagmin-1-like [Acipenser oxyrinchus oxyrinchus]|uniref:Extended synaptotagmin-1-like n=1 Tax=Acipenser oxyrinchus oxyrinchus TaxID=40147 RepID=A0AAD8FPV2_ACIOX|nr:extended synaptotagmin-1-like [Acipenser oxyrinchus oxyrinchus]